MDKKFYIYEYDACPNCKGNLREAGYNKSKQKILQCIKCNNIILERDLREEK